MKPKSIPHRFRESQFQRYAAQLSRAVDVFPEAIAFEPVSVTPAVFAQGIRDAITAKDNYGWKWPNLNEKKYAEVRDHLTVSVKEDVVAIGPRHTLVRSLKSHYAEMKQVMTLKVYLSEHRSIAINTLRSLLELVESGAVTSGVRYEVHNMVWDAVPSFESAYPNVLIQRHESDDTVAILI